MHSVTSNAAAKALEWKVLEINYTFTAVGVATIPIKENIPAFKEAVIVTSIDTNAIIYDPDLQYIKSTTYMKYTPNGEYDIAYDIYFDRVNKSLYTRLTVKGSSSTYPTIYRMLYR